MPTYPTLSENPQYPLRQSKDKDVKIIKSAFEGGYVHTRPRFTRARRVWELTYEVLPTADMNSLSGFIDSVSGAANSFTWEHPQENGNTYTVRFEESPEFINTDPGYWTTKFTLEEV